jgi:uncharacterized protein
MRINDQKDTSMSTLRESLSQNLKDAMKAGDKLQVATVRLIQAALKDRDIEARGLGKEPLSDDDIMSLLQKMIKQRQESHGIFVLAGRDELAQQEASEIAIISAYLPQQLEEAQVKQAIQEAIAELGATSIKEMGKVVGVLKAKYSGQMDFAKASGLVKTALNG